MARPNSLIITDFLVATSICVFAKKIVGGPSAELLADLYETHRALAADLRENGPVALDGMTLNVEPGTGFLYLTGPKQAAPKEAASS